MSDDDSKFWFSRDEEDICDSLPCSLEGYVAVPKIEDLTSNYHAPGYRPLGTASQSKPSTHTAEDLGRFPALTRLDTTPLSDSSEKNSDRRSISIPDLDPHEIKPRLFWSTPKYEEHLLAQDREQCLKCKCIGHAFRLASILGSILSALWMFQNSCPLGHPNAQNCASNCVSHHVTSSLYPSCDVWSNVASLIGFTGSTTCFYQLNNQDRYQDYAMLLGITSGTVIGLGTGKELQDTLLLLVPWTILMALSMSCVGHAVVRHKKRRLVNLAEVEHKEDC